MTQHIHHDLIVQWAKDTTQVVEFRYRKNKWEKVAGSPGWHTHAEYRLVEPRHKHQDLIDQKAARPELIVLCSSTGHKAWVRLNNSNPDWNPDLHYRLVEPAKKKVKMWQWVMRSAQGVVFTSASFHKDEASACVACNTSKPIHRALWTEIEVEE